MGIFLIHVKFVPHKKLVLWSRRKKTNDRVGGVLSGIDYAVSTVKLCSFRATR